MGIYPSLLLLQINWAGTVPERYFMTKDVEKFAKLNGVKKVVVPRQASFDVPVEVKRPGLVLDWEYEVTCYDIGFKVLFEEKGPNGTETEELIPMHKFETEYEPLRGSMICKRQGNYIIVFDNTYSWFNSKEVHYRTCLGSPKENPSILP
ncbi:hypothetical protein AVEN_21048-1 [Araneus ventricosus]|uniref:GOLD domain-containing protein n=1 Tax=Araneus ventricosus TaxID=182803 RepID=A0A4Y2UT78_ARAVE|nr:hypothetical protein AVEN_21048-1 [Araneus ventricosus]